MKKYLSFIAFAMLSVFCLVFSSCSADDDELDPQESSSSSIQINGKTYRMSRDVTMEGYWDEEDEEGTFTVSVEKKVGSSIDIHYWTFTYSDVAQPKVGDDFAKKDLYLDPDDPEVYGEYFTCTHESGSAKVVSIDKNKGIITIQFNNLKMVGEGHSYTFNGTVPVDFNYGRTSWRQ